MNDWCWYRANRIDEVLTGVTFVAHRNHRSGRHFLTGQREC